VGLYSELLLPRCLDWVMGRREFSELRPRCVGAVEGRVLELGFGSGHNLPFYPARVAVLYALEPSDLARRLAARRVAAAGFPVEMLEVGAERVPLADASVDHVVSTWTLCTVADAASALAEVRRVLAPGGRLHFLEHGRSHDPRVARWQDRLTPLQKRLAGGCHLNRPIDELVRAAGFVLEELEEFELPRAPRVAGHMYAGVARGAGLSGC
jgi:ubiquinone/menaquinone biosynthesis C-methylase UbiE